MVKIPIGWVLFFALLASACSPSYKKFLSDYSFNRNILLPDYADPNYWAAHPNKKDPSDSIPQPLKNGYQYDSTVDVFFLYPTSFTQKDDKKWNADINDAKLNAKTDYSSILYQASVFNEYRIFAPRYRQAHIRSYFTTDTVAALAAFELAYQDIKKAFQYFLANNNDGHPIIIASHSQGTTHAIRLLKEFFDGTALQDKLVAAYLVGMYIPENYFTHLKICTDPTKTNCYCGWRTFQVNYVPPFVQKEKIRSSVTNPLSWTTNADPASFENNQGAILRKFNRVYNHVADAQIKDGVLWTHKPRFPGSFLLRTKNYHVGDINLYYYSLRNNVRQRVIVYKK